MTSFTKRIMIAAAAVVVVAGSASAQSLKANVPFPFSARGVVMPAGEYQVNVLDGAGGPAFRISNAKSHQAVLLLPGAARDPQKSWVANGSPMLTFECGARQCALKGIWAGTSMRDYSIPRPKLGLDEVSRVETIGMRASKGD